MFVRFKKRSLNYWADTSLEVILVRNHRVGTKTKQECVKYLASIRLSQVECISPQWVFWKKVHRKLDTLNLPGDVRNSIEKKILAYVPMPDGMKSQVKRKAPRDFRKKMNLLFKRLKRVG